MFGRDSIDYAKCDILVKNVTNINRVIVIGINLHKIINSNGKEVFLAYVSFHITKSYVQLVSTQTYHHMHGDYSEANYFK